MSSLKRWIAAILIMLAVAAYLQFGEMLLAGRVDCLTSWVDPDFSGAFADLEKKAGVDREDVKDYGIYSDKGKIGVYFELTDGRKVGGLVCMTGDTMQPSTALLEK